MRYAIRASEGLVEAPRAPEEAEGAADLAETDAVLITEISTRAQVSFFFVLLSICHSPVLDGFDGHFQASVHLTLSSAVNKS